MRKKKNIWIISEYYYPIVTSTGYYITEIAERLASDRDNIHVICTNARYNEKEKVRVPKYEIRNGVHIHRVLTGSINKNNFLLRTIRLMQSSLRLFFSILLKVQREDSILIVTNPAFLIVFMPVIKFIKRIRYQILVHDIFPENLSAIGVISKKSILYALIKKIFDFSYSKSLRCIAIGRDMKSVLEHKLQNKSEIVVVSNWADTSDVFPVRKKETKLISGLGIADKFIFQFAGNLGFAQGLDNLTDAIKEVKNEDIHFLFVGTGAYEEIIKNFIQKNNLKNITMVGFQDRKTQNDFLNACDVGIVTLNDEMYGLGVPSKSYNIMSTGKPLLVIADERSEISLCVSEYNIGWVVPPNTPALLTETFEKIYKEYKENQKFNLNDPREVATKYFSKEIILEKYCKLFDL